MGIAREFYMAPTKAKFNEMAESLFSRDSEDAYPHMRDHPDLKALDKKRYELRSYSYRSTPGGGRAPGGRTMNAIERGTFIAGPGDDRSSLRRFAPPVGVPQGKHSWPTISPGNHSVDLGNAWVAWLFARISLDEAMTLIQPILAK